MERPALPVDAGLIVIVRINCGLVCSEGPLQRSLRSYNLGGELGLHVDGLLLAIGQLVFIHTLSKRGRFLLVLE